MDIQQVRVKTIAEGVSIKIEPFLFKPSATKPNYDLQYADLCLLDSSISKLIESPAYPVTIIDEIFMQIIDEVLILYTKVNGSDPQFRQVLKMIFISVRYDLSSIVSGHERALNERLNYGLSSTPNVNLHQKYASQFRKSIYQNLLELGRQRMRKIERYRALLEKVKNYDPDKF